MKIISTKIPDVLIIEPQVFADDRGLFYESYNEKAFINKTGITAHFVQDNHSHSCQNVLRGLHYQIQQPQGKLVRAVAGAVFDVAVDMRKSSPTFGQWVSYLLSAENKRHCWMPPGFAHGFLVLSAAAEILYKTTDYYAPQHERTLLWNDLDLAISWPLTASPILSPKDQAGQLFKNAEVYAATSPLIPAV
ncbi:MAG: dTDP-4-dehydrorhamnose 3,5-epimerase [Pseudanabaenales cyanobacterium]|nr:dTDP-4-dehydrorhamnose 3,5-epimerase [Pseudanabaenales cyanobacterium]